MMSPPYVRALDRKTDVLDKAIKLFVTCCTKDDHAQRVESVQKIREAAKDLEELAGLENSPEWLHDLHFEIRNLPHDDVEKFNQNLPTVLVGIIRTWSKIREHTWEHVYVIDFEMVYSKARGQSRLDELTDQIVGLLEKISSLPGCDGKRLQELLQRLIESLKKSKTASWSSTVAAWRYTGVFIKHLAYEVLKKASGAESILDALKNTYDEIAGEIAGVHRQSASQLVSSVDEDFATLPLNLKWMEDAQHMPILPALENPNFIEGEFQKRLLEPEIANHHDGDRTGPQA